MHRPAKAVIHRVVRRHVVIVEGVPVVPVDPVCLAVPAIVRRREAIGRDQGEVREGICECGNAGGSWTTISCGFGAAGDGGMFELVPMMLSPKAVVLLDPSVTLAIVVPELEYNGAVGFAIGGGQS